MPTLSRRFRLASLLPLLAAFACGRPAATPPAAPQAAETAAVVADVFSFARPREIAVRHLALDLTVDFERRTLGGTATLELVHHAPATELVLDTQGLTIEGVTLDGGKTTTFTLAEPRAHLGQALAIAVGPGTRTVEVRYHTAPSAGALQWLEPAQTAGGVAPYLFTQSQPILARSWVPCQDTPQVRMTYEAVVKVPQGLVAVMSAANATTASADGVYHFRMAQPIPSYLLALAVGDIAFAPIGDRAGVFAEPSVLPGAAAELAPIEAMMRAAEALYGPYRWDRYDVLIMPPSFPIGGMENPRLTFATPTILAGDGSLLALVAHELAHSWSGNLVTNATWNDLWLNEGFTVYFERRIVEATEGRDTAEMQAQLGYQDLEATVEELGATSPLTELHTDLAADADPGDSFSDVAYEKGYFFLRLVEETVGRERFDAFLAEHFETWAFRSLDTPTFVASLETKLLAADPALAAKIAVASWIDGPGIPTNCPRPHTSAFAKVDAELAALQAGKPARELVTAGWNTQQWMHFLRHLPPGLELGRLAELDAAFGFTSSGNSEIAAAWFEQVVPLRYQAADPAFEAFLARVGRQKFLKPLYASLLESGQADRARAIYLRARPTYHPVTVATLDKVLDWDQNATTTLPSTPPASSAS